MYGDGFGGDYLTRMTKIMHKGAKRFGGQCYHRCRHIVVKKPQRRGLDVNHIIFLSFLSNAYLNCLLPHNSILSVFSQQYIFIQIPCISNPHCPLYRSTSTTYNNSASLLTCILSTSLPPGASSPHLSCCLSSSDLPPVQAAPLMSVFCLEFASLLAGAGKHRGGVGTVQPLLEEFSGDTLPPE